MKSDAINTKLMEKLTKLKEAALKVHEEQVSETMEQEGII